MHPITLIVTGGTLIVTALTARAAVGALDAAKAAQRRASQPPAPSVVNRL